jgi:hypothetical protein
MFKKDSIGLGILLAIFAPALSFVVYKQLKYSSGSFRDIFGLMKENPSLISASIIISLLGNLVLLTFFLNKKYDRSAKGVFAITCVYALVSLVLKYLL